MTCSGTCGLQVQRKPEAVKVCPDIIVVGVALFKPQSGAWTRIALSLAARRGRLPSRDLRALRVKISTETLKVGPEMQDEASVKSRRGRIKGFGGAKAATAAQLCLHFVQTGRAVILPIGIRTRRARRTSIANDNKTSRGDKTRVELFPKGCRVHRTSNPTRHPCLFPRDVFKGRFKGSGPGPSAFIACVATAM